MNFGNAEPVEHVGHQGLEARILHAGYGLGTVEIPTKGQVSRVDGVVASMASKYDTALLLFGLVAALLALAHVVH